MSDLSVPARGRLEAPEPLTRRVAQLLAAVDATDPVARHLAAAEYTVERLLRAQSTARASALDLLAADALATYAFELAADDPDGIPDLAARAMRRFAALAAEALLEADVSCADGSPTGASPAARSLPGASLARIPGSDAQPPG